MINFPKGFNRAWATRYPMKYKTAPYQNNQMNHFLIRAFCASQNPAHMRMTSYLGSLSGCT